MKFKTHFSELQFGQNDNSYFKNFHYLPADDEEARFGELFLTIEILNNPGGSEVVAQEMFAKLQETYYSHLGNDDYSSFEAALREVNGTLNDLLERSPQKWLGRINAVVMVRSGQNLHLAQTGAAEAYLLRSGKLVRISETISDSQEQAAEGEVNTFTNISSGEVADGDQLILSTEHLLRVISQDELERIFNRDKGMNFIATLQEKIILEPGQTIGLAFVSVMAEAPAVEEAPATVSLAPETDREPLTNDGYTSARRRKPRGGASLFSRTSDWFKSKMPQVKEGTVNARESVSSWAESVRNNTDQRTITFALIIMVVVLAVGIYVIYSKNSEAHRVEVFQEDFKDLKAQVARAENLTLFDPNGAIKVLTTSDQEADRLLAMGISVPSVEAVKKQIQNNLDKVYGIERIVVSDDNQIADIATAKSDARPVGLVRIDNSINAFDEDTWYTVTLDKVSMATISPDVTIKTGIYFPDQEVTVFTTDDRRLIEWNGTQADFMKTEDETWHNAVGLGEYSRYLYFLDPGENQIWKYGRGADGYSQASAYNNNTDLTQATDLAIDGDIYISSLDGKIKQIFRGEQTDWFVELPEGITVEKPRRIRTSLEGKSVYVQDNDNRILKFQKKDGVYLGQYVFEVGDEQIDDFIIDDENMKIFVLVGSKIYMTPIVI